MFSLHSFILVPLPPKKHLFWLMYITLMFILCFKLGCLPLIVPDNFKWSVNTWIVPGTCSSVPVML